MTILLDGQAVTICATCHRDGTVTYFDPRSQQWIERSRTIPQVALDILPSDEAARVRGTGIEVVS
jgi:hypothetical protein